MVAQGKTSRLTISVTLLRRTPRLRDASSRTNQSSESLHVDAQGADGGGSFRRYELLRQIGGKLATPQDASGTGLSTSSEETLVPSKGHRSGKVACSRQAHVACKRNPQKLVLVYIVTV